MKKLPLLFSLFLMTTAHAQQDMVFSLYPENYLYYNPAYAGVKQHGVANISARDQWRKIDRNPVSYMISYDQHIDSTRSGIGIIAWHDQMGLESTEFIGLNYNYRFYIRDCSLRIGTQIAGYRKSIDFSGIISIQPTGLPTTKQSQIKPDVDVGAWFYSPNRFYAGISARHLLEARFDKLSYDMARHYYFASGLEKKLTGTYNAMLSALVKSDLASTVANLNLRVTYSNLLTIGASYRINDTNPFVVHAGIRHYRVMVSAAYDFANGPLGSSFEGNIKYYLDFMKPQPAPKKKSIKLKPLDEE